MSQLTKGRTIFDRLLKPAHSQMNVKIHQPIGSGKYSEFMPFLLLDDLEAEGDNPGFGDHPHRGQETMTYILEGSLVHQDSNGGKGIIGTGDMQVMCAGSGIMHNETPIVDPVTNRTKGIQLWVALSAAHLKDKAAYQDVLAKDCKTVSVASGVSIKVIAGDAFGVSAPMFTKTPVSYFDITFSGQAEPFIVSIPQHWNAFVHVLQGNPTVDGSTGRAHETFFMKKDGEGVQLGNEIGSAARLLLIAGDPLEGQNVHRYGPFVSTSRAGVSQAFIDYRMGVNGFEKASRWESDPSNSIR